MVIQKGDRRCPRCLGLFQFNVLYKVSEPGIYPVQRLCPGCGLVASTFIFAPAKVIRRRIPEAEEGVLASLSVGPATLRELGMDIGTINLNALGVALNKMKKEGKIDSDGRKPAMYSLSGKPL